MVRCRLFVEYIDPRHGDLAGSQPFKKCLFIVKAPSCTVDEDHTVFHSGDLLFADHTDGLFCFWCMDRDDVTGKDIFKVLGISDIKIGRFARIDIRVICNDIHFECFCSFPYTRTDITKTDDAQLFVFELCSVPVLSSPDTVKFEVVVCIRELSDTGEHMCECKFHCSNGIGRGYIHNNDSLLACSGNIDIVHTDTCTYDRCYLLCRSEKSIIDICGRTCNGNICQRNDLCYEFVFRFIRCIYEFYFIIVCKNVQTALVNMVTNNNCFF